MQGKDRGILHQALRRRLVELANAILRIMPLNQFAVMMPSLRKVGFYRAAAERKYRNHPVEYIDMKTRSGFLMSGNTADFIQRQIFNTRYWDRRLSEIVEATLRPSDVFIDVGANVGYFSLLASQCVRSEGLVIALEPVSENAKLLRANIRSNGLSNVIVHTVAASDQSGKVTINLGPAHNSGQANTRALSGNDRSEVVEKVRADDLVAPDVHGRVRMIKIDVEGAEAFVIRGLHQTMLHMPPGGLVVVEVTPAWLSESADSVTGIISYLDSLGFSVNSDLGDGYDRDSTQEQYEFVFQKR